MLFSRSFPNSTEQIKLTLAAYQKEKMGPDVSRIIVLDPPQKAAGFNDQLNKTCHLPVESYLAFDPLPVHKNMDWSSWKENDLSPVSALGFLLGDISKQINFLPSNIQAREIFKRQKKVWLKLAVILSLTAGLFILATNLQIYKAKVILQKLQAKVKEIDPQAEKAKRKIEAIEFLYQKTKSPVLIAEVMRELYRLCPADISFNSLSLDGQGTLTIQGLATVASSVNNFQNNLVNSVLFKTVNLEFATKRKRLEDEYTDFKIVGQLALPETKNE
jgi:Tfp pilus assembly protein PilN